jgi:NAD(P)-dependent dehydrogenase (short-subunit alcohol dehydrogenase family)
MVFTIDLAGKLTVVTGGNRGIGLAIARDFAKAGSNVAIIYRSHADAPAVAAKLAAEFGVKVVAFKAAAEDSKQVVEALEAILAEFKVISPDYLVVNHGIAHWSPAHETQDEDFERLLRVNLFGSFYVAREVGKLWVKEAEASASQKVVGKSIVFISSISGVVSMYPQQQCAYNCSKGGLTMLAKSMAGDWAKFGIRVNTVSPGYIATEMSTQAEGAQAWVPEWKQRTPLGEFGSPEAVAHSTLLLCSDASNFTTGSDLIVDGGYTVF